MEAKDTTYLRVQNSKIVNGRDETILLRGFCLGGWMNLENFIIGYPGHESGLRTGIERYQESGLQYDSCLTQLPSFRG